MSGEDDELKNAYLDFHKMVVQEQGAVRNATLVSVGQLTRQSDSVQADMSKVLSTVNQTTGKTEALTDSTGRIHRYLESTTIFSSSSTTSSDNTQVERLLLSATKFYKSYHHSTFTTSKETYSGSIIKALVSGYWRPTCSNNGFRVTRIQSFGVPESVRLYFITSVNLVTRF